MTTIDRARLTTLLDKEDQRFVAAHEQSARHHERARQHLPGGVPMNWMTRWPGRHPLFVERAQGARLITADNVELIDFCLGDTGAMAGHAPAPLVRELGAQLPRGLTTMLPVAAIAAVGRELTSRFGLPNWQMTLTATDANRFAIRLARLITGRPKVLVFNWCYHGTVDESFATIERGQVVARSGNLGPPVPLDRTTRVVEFNDLAALEAELAQGDVACVLCEPAMTNIGIVLPEPDFHQRLRELTRRHDTLLIIDETHTICAGHGGCTREWRLAPDFLTIGKAIGGGYPAAVYGYGEEVARRLHGQIAPGMADTGGIGGTLAGNVMSVMAIHATLLEVLTEPAFAHMIAMAERFTAGVQATIDRLKLPWVVQRLGARAEYWFRDTLPRDGAEAAATIDADLDRYMHLATLNRGILMTPFHNMALMCPATTAADVDRHTEVFAELASALVA